MTICIAALCEEGQAVVVASDRMLSAPFLTIEFDHPDAKIDTINPRCVVLSAGDALSVTDILSDSSGISNQLQDPTVQLIMDEVKQRFVQVRGRLINERLFQPRGLSFKKYYTGVIQGLPSDLAMLLDNQVQNFQLGVSLTVAGIDSTGAHIFSIEDPGVSQCFDRLGYHAIGSGHRHAIVSLVSLQHDRKINLKSAVYNVYSAKKHAEMAPGVGQTTDISIIDKDGTREISENTLEILSTIFAKQFAPNMSNINNEIGSLVLEESGNGRTNKDGNEHPKSGS